MSGALGNSGGRLYSFGAQPVLIDCNFVVDSTNGNGLGIRNLKGQGVKSVKMHSSAASGTPAVGLAWIELTNNYNRYLGGFSGFASPVSGSPIAIDSGTAGLTIGNPYIIASVGAGPAGQATISPVADVAGSLASKYFMLYDSYGNAFCIFIVVNGVGSRPNLGPELSPAQLANGARGLSYHQLSLATGATAAAQTTALSTLINALSSGVIGQASFTTSGGGGATLTVISTQNAPLAGIPQDGSTVIPASNGIPLPIYFTIASGSATAGSVWTDGSGNLYTVSTTLVAGTLLKTTGTLGPVPATGTLSFVSGSGATTALSYSAAVAGLATGYSFALTVNDNNLQDWVAIGLPSGLTPTVGQSFVAKSTGAGGSTGTVIAPGVSGITSVEVIGDPNVSLAPHASGGSPNVGGWILVQFLAPTSSSVTTAIPTAPANGSVVGMSFYVDARLSPSNISAH